MRRAGSGRSHRPEMATGVPVRKALLAVAALTLIAPRTAAAQDAGSSFRRLDAAFRELTERVAPAVVQVVTEGYEPDAAGADGLLALHRGAGSGVIFDPDGWVVTNLHVVENAARVRVVLAVPRETAAETRSILEARGVPLDARIVGIDRETDLAVLKVERQGLPWLPFGDSDEVHQAQLVFAFGSPFGFANSVSMGVVSAVARQLEPDAPMIYMQTDAPIHPGSSGGPLVDIRGRVVGINTLIVSGSGRGEGIGFAAPSNIVAAVTRQIREHGRVRRGVIGVHAQTLTPPLAAGLSLPRDWGVLLGDVYPGGPAFRAGLRPGDVVLRLDGKPMENGRQLDVNVYRKGIGDRVRVEALRGDSVLAVDVEVTERRDPESRFADLVNPDENLVPRLGILALGLNDEVVSLLPGTRRRSGVLVAARSPGPGYWSEGLLPGDVIYEVNRVPVSGLATLRSALSGLRAGDVAVVQVERQGRMAYVPVEVR